MVRGQGWKYIRYHDDQEVLYDLQNDPGETENRISDPASAEQKQIMRRRWKNGSVKLAG